MSEEIDLVSAERVLEQLDGATIQHSGVDANEGVHFFLADGRILIIACWGAMAISICQQDDRSLH